MKKPLNLKVLYKMNKLIYLLLLFVLSCAQFNYSTSLENSDETFKLKDKSGEFLFKRISKLDKSKFISKSVISPILEQNVDLEKVISISRISTTGKKTLVPKISQSTLWFDKKKYFSQIKVDSSKNLLTVLMRSPEKKWSGTKKIEMPSGNIVCFFTQIPECLKFHGLLNPSPHARDILVIWDTYPFHSEIYANINPNIFTRASIEYSGKMKELNKFTLSLGNQIIFYLFNNKNEFEKMYWIAQGMTIVKQVKDVGY